MREDIQTHSQPDGLDGVKGKNLLLTMVLKIVLTIAEALGGWLSGRPDPIISDTLYNNKRSYLHYR